MPRNQNAGNLALRNRNRVTNKTRLKVIKGTIDADPIVLDEDEERARVVSTAGVDAEDANEHHLQAVLSAASHRATALAQKSTRDKAEKRPETSTAYIPVPDAAGLVEHYVELYPTDKWTEPESYVKFSYTVDQCISTALADGHTYFMDERDEEWLEKNNQDARGEGTSTQGASLASGTTTRSGALHRSAKSRGKEPEVLQPVLMSPDEFELVMGVFEKATHDNTPFLHVEGTVIPPFSDYQDVFANDLSPSTFATYVRPPNIPPPAMLLRMARACYPHWRERRAEREGHRIIPALNFDESDTNNESYICFRRREIKAIRKTRTTQVSTTDKLLRLKGELASALELTRNVLFRESFKREGNVEARRVCETRMAFADLKRKFPALGGRDDEELLFDKERVSKKARADASSASAILKIKRANGDMSSSPSPLEPCTHPKARALTLQLKVEEYVKHQKERDHHWEDQIDNPYQQLPLSTSERMFKLISAIDSPASAPPSLTELRAQSSRHLRLRAGRGGRMHLDRRMPGLRLRHGGVELIRFESRNPKADDLTPEEAEDRLSRLVGRWKFDSDASPASFEGNEEEDRVLLDDFDPKFMRHSVQLLQESDHQLLSTDPRLFLPDGHSGINVVLPFRISPMQQAARRESLAYQRAPPLPSMLAQAQPPPPPVAEPQAASAVPSSTSPVAVATQAPAKPMPPRAAPQQIRVPSNVPQRPPSSSSHSSASGPRTSPTNATATASLMHAASVPSQSNLNGGGQAAPSANQSISLSLPATIAQNHVATSSSPLDASLQNRVPSPARPRSQNQAHPNLQQMGMNGYPTNGISNGSFAGYPNGFTGHTAGQQQQLLAMQQATFRKAVAMSGQGMQNMAMPPSMPVNSNVASRGVPSAYAQHMQSGMNGNNLLGPVNMNLKLPASRQMQWAAAIQQRGQSVPNGTDMSHNLQIPTMNGMVNGMNGMNGMVNGMINGMVHAPSVNGHLSPPRSAHSPANHLMGMGQDKLSPSHQQMMAHSLSPHLGSPAMPHVTPPRNMQTPIPTSSPLLQQQHIVSSLNQGQGY